jgi:hypothetical protein
LFNLIQQLFSSKAPAEAAGWHATAFTPAQAKRHARWVEQGVYQNWLGPYFKAYHLQKAGIDAKRGLRVQQLREQGRQGALFYFDPSIGPGNFRHLFEYIGERILALGYRRACSDQRTQHQCQHSEKVLKQLFKPQPTDCPQTGCCNQRFGLITIDLVALNGQPLFIRVASNAVLQSGFTPACSFEELVRAVFDVPLPTVEMEPLVQECLERA